MNESLKKISLESISFYIEKNLDDFYVKSSRHSNFTSHIEEKVSWVLAKSADWPDCIFRANFENLDVDYEVKTIRNLIREKKAPNGWTVGPLTKPKNLGNFLEKNGFSNVYQQAGMAVNLKNLKNKISNINNFTVEIVNNEESLRQWSKTVSKVFNLKIDFDLIKFLSSESEVKLYLANFKGETVSTLMLFLSSGVAGLHAVSTLPEYRSKGFALRISGAALTDAFKIGYNVGVLQASSLGEKVYRKLGFQKYCDIISYTLNQNE